MTYWDFETLQLRAIVSDALVHSASSAMPNGVLAKYLARRDAAVLGVLGSGNIARWAAAAVWSQRPIRTIRVYSPTPAHPAEVCTSLAAASTPRSWSARRATMWWRART
jgi:ornithine cyclodeaminase/alanine dehydrogenase-like protein (mu-crystallin family)